MAMAAELSALRAEVTAARQDLLEVRVETVRLQEW